MQAYGIMDQPRKQNPVLLTWFATTRTGMKEDAVSECVIVLKHEAGGTVLVPSSVLLILSLHNCSLRLQGILR